MVLFPLTFVMPQLLFSLPQLSNYWNPFVENANRTTTVIVAINKTDLTNGSERSEISDGLMETFPMVYFTSAKTGEGMTELFETIARIGVPGNVNELGIVSLDEPQKKCC
jgi:tRNA U34 5-carboxymethylaminomethyl modifying GTPase MnmE/TrmE